MVGMGDENVVDVHPHKRHDGKGGENVEDRVVCRKRTPWPTERKRAGGKGMGFGGRPYGEDKRAAHERRDVKGPEAVAGVKFGEVKVSKPGCGQERRTRGKVEGRGVL